MVTVPPSKDPWPTFVNLLSFVRNSKNSFMNKSTKDIWISTWDKEMEGTERSSNCLRTFLQALPKTGSTSLIILVGTPIPEKIKNPKSSLKIDLSPALHLLFPSLLKKLDKKFKILFPKTSRHT